MAPQIERYLVGGEPCLVKSLLDIVTTDPETTVHSVTRNDQGDPERLVVSMDPTRATALQAALGSRIIIELDELLDL